MAFSSDKVSTSETGPRSKERLLTVIFQDNGRHGGKKSSRETTKKIDTQKERTRGKQREKKD
jgi:hypothetical protein